jgi:hypothetical protein
MNDEMASGRRSMYSKDKLTSVTAAGPAPAPIARRAGTWFLHELREILPPLIFFFVGFNLIVLTTNLILADYSVAVGSFMLATTGALVVGKAVPVANAMPFIRRYDRATLIRPILFKTLVYWAAVFIARLLEALVEFWLVQGHPLGEFLPHLASTFSWDHFAAIQIWILVLFLIYVTASELNHLFGDGELRRILFTYRRSELQLNRRQRIRELVRLSQLADAHSIDEFHDPTNNAHIQLVDMCAGLRVNRERTPRSNKETNNARSNRLARVSRTRETI